MKLIIPLLFPLLLPSAISAQKNSEYASGVVPGTTLRRTVLSPNNDGVDDAFVINSRSISQMSIRILNAKGELVISSEQPEFRWDGHNSAGNPAPAGNYTYIITAEGLDGKKFSQKGEINLVR